jgi:hypothetical protein
VIFALFIIIFISVHIPNLQTIAGEPISMMRYPATVCLHLTAEHIGDLRARIADVEIGDAEVRSPAGQKPLGLAQVRHEDGR